MRAYVCVSAYVRKRQTTYTPLINKDVIPNSMQRKKLLESLSFYYPYPTKWGRYNVVVFDPNRLLKIPKKYLIFFINLVSALLKSNDLSFMPFDIIDIDIIH
jgi:hypothetical protein